MDINLNENFLANRLLLTSNGGHQHSNSKHTIGVDRNAPTIERRYNTRIELSFFYEFGMRMKKKREI